MAFLSFLEAKTQIGLVFTSILISNAMWLDSHSSWGALFQLTLVGALTRRHKSLQPFSSVNSIKAFWMSPTITMGSGCSLLIVKSRAYALFPKMFLLTCQLLWFLNAQLCIVFPLCAHMWTWKEYYCQCLCLFCILACSALILLHQLWLFKLHQACTQRLCTDMFLNRSKNTLCLSSAISLWKTFKKHCQNDPFLAI